jgi:hypothetical protein
MVQARLKRDPLAVFVNAPFDPAYDPMLEALVFTVFASGYRARCALEVNDSGDIRLDKLVRLIGQSTRSIHDLSRIKPTDGGNDLPRFNMPFELGMAMGAKRFGPSRKSDSIKIMVAEPYKLPEYLSDLGGNDPDAHHNQPPKVIRIVRDFLHTAPNGKPLPGPTKLVATFDEFKSKLPAIAHGIQHEPGEIGVRTNFLTFVWCIAEFLKRAES